MMGLLELVDKDTIKAVGFDPESPIPIEVHGRKGRVYTADVSQFNETFVVIELEREGDGRSDSEWYVGCFRKSQTTLKDYLVYIVTEERKVPSDEVHDRIIRLYSYSF